MFDKQTHITKMRPYADKVVSYFKNKGIEFLPTDGELDNVIFVLPDKKEIKVSHHSFYGYSRIACIYKEKGENFIEAIVITDEAFMNNFMKPIIETLILKIQSV